jgi:branched-chain amino acid transport system substrate-binding protein
MFRTSSSASPGPRGRGWAYRVGGRVSVIRRHLRGGLPRTIVAMGVAVGVAACGSSSGGGGGGGNSKGPISIGASLSLSGDFAADGVNFEHGYQLWAAYQNAHGGLLGRKVKLDVVSDSSSPSQVVTNYEKLISVDHDPLVFGPYSTLLSVPAQKTANRFGYLLMTGAGGGPSAFASGLHNYFDTGPQVVDTLDPFAQWIASMPASKRPKTVAYATSDDPFTQPIVEKAKALLQAAGVKTVYYKVFPAEVTDYTPIADAVAASKAQIAVIGSTAVPDVAPFVQTFATDHYDPQAFIATGGPDQGSAFSKAVGAKNTEGVMFPNGWYPGANFPGSNAMIKAYVAKYGGSAANVSADVAEAYSVGQVMTQAIQATHSLSNSKLMSYLHSGHTFSTVEGPVSFDSKGANTKSTLFVMQWQHNGIVQVLPTSDPLSKKMEFPKPPWGS